MDKKIVNILEGLKMFISNNTFLLLKESLMLKKRYLVNFIKKDGESFCKGDSMYSIKYVISKF